MFPQNNTDLGESLYKTWTDKEKRDEIAKLVTGYRSGLPLGILCKMSESIAGSQKRARKHLHALMTAGERQAAIAKESAAIQIVAKGFLE